VHKLNTLTSVWSIKSDGFLGYLVAGRDSAGVGRVLRLDNGLKEVWSGSVGAKSLLYDAKPADDGTVWAAGGAGTGQQMLAAHFDTAGKLLGAWTYAGGYCGALWDIFPLTGGGFIAGGQHCPSGNPRYFGVLRAGADGGQQWYNSELLRNDGTTHSLLLLPTGDAIGAAWTYLARWTPAGQVANKTTYALDGSYSEYTGAELLADGSTLLLGQSGTAIAQVGVISRVGATGELLWKTQLGVNGAGVVVANTAVELADGGHLAAGYAKIFNTESPWLARLDGRGNPVKSEVPAELDFAVIADSLITDSTGALFAMNGNAGTATLLWTDAFGNTTCAKSGPCAGKSVLDCADTNPCTADLCDANHAGCWHQPLPDGAACGPGKTCTASICK
jgi:hypothetical protein